jgi:hypothetical protein
VTAIARPNRWPTPVDDVAGAGRSDVIDVSRPRPSKTFWRPVFEWFEAAALVWLAAVALIAVGSLLVLVVRAIGNALSWVVGHIG